ncbi:hypothetical protein BRADI_1g09835v3 [Brachypodium distachyon]|uniref:RNase H type-1 domain-containing protein n=1 Tax=Brachypodium distachyon TaxID=15368 RepID=A0A0Q3N9L0_BRADI|nr:hypothetical protein BRADI_1g09835v3 [Brachypodium distachyon]
MTTHHDLESSSPRTTVAGAPRPREQPKRWFPPPSGHAKINVDAALSKLGNGGSVDAVCRDETGFLLGSSALVFPGISDPVTLEALACREALALAEDLQVTRLRVASDCLEEIKQTSSCFESVSFVHERRTSNLDAHGLASASASLPVGRHT